MSVLSSSPPPSPPLLASVLSNEVSTENSLLCHIQWIHLSPPLPQTHYTVRFYNTHPWTFLKFFTARSFCLFCCSYSASLSDSAFYPTHLAFQYTQVTGNNYPITSVWTNSLSLPLSPLASHSFPVLCRLSASFSIVQSSHLRLTFLYLHLLPLLMFFPGLQKDLC